MSNSPQPAQCTVFVKGLCFSRCNKRKHLPPHALFHYFLFSNCTVHCTQWRGCKNRSMHFKESECNRVYLHFNFKHLADTCIQRNHNKHIWISLEYTTQTVSQSKTYNIRVCHVSSCYKTAECLLSPLHIACGMYCNVCKVSDRGY